MTQGRGLPDRDRVTLGEVAAYMRLSKQTIRRRIKAKTFPANIDTGRQLIFSRADILAIGAQPAADDTTDQEVEDALIRAAAALPNRRTRKIPEMENAKRRKRARALDRPEAETTLRLVANNTRL